MIIENYSDFDEIKIKKKYIKTSSENVLIIEVNDIHDGPLSGICEYAGGVYYYCCITEFEHLTEKQRYPRKYILIKFNEDLINRQKQIEKLKSENETLKIKSLLEKPYFVLPSDVVAWYEVDENKNNDAFLQSYYQWLQKT